MSERYGRARGSRPLWASEVTSGQQQRRSGIIAATCPAVRVRIIGSESHLEGRSCRCNKVSAPGPQRQAGVERRAEDRLFDSGEVGPPPDGIGDRATAKAAPSRGRGGSPHAGWQLKSSHDDSLAHRSVKRDTSCVQHRLATTLLILLSACGSEGAPYRAEVLSTPFPGTVLTARAMGGECTSDGCLVDYTVRITNPTGRDVDVQTCILVEPPQIQLPVVGAGSGIAIQAHGVRTVNGRFVLPVEKEAAQDLVRQDVSCTGLDWHGNSPD
jgi:hypothetical protein